MCKKSKAPANMIPAALLLIGVAIAYVPVEAINVDEFALRDTMGKLRISEEKLDSAITNMLRAALPLFTTDTLLRTNWREANYMATILAANSTWHEMEKVMDEATGAAITGDYVKVKKLLDKEVKSLNAELFRTTSKLVRQREGIQLLDTSPEFAKMLESFDVTAEIAARLLRKLETIVEADNFFPKENTYN